MNRLILFLTLAAAGVIACATARTKPAAPRVARIWHGQVAASRGDEYERYIYESGIRKLRATPGNLGVQLFRRTVGDREDFIVISYWPSEDAIRAYAGAEVTKARLLPRDPEFLIDPEPEVRHFTIVADEKP